MIEVDVSILNDLIKSYSSTLKKIEQNNTDIIHNFNELNKYWQDTNISKLKSSSNLEEQRMLKLEEDIKLQLDFYSYVSIEYKKIGDKIKCNLEARDLIDNKIGNIIDLINNILNQYNDLGDISFFDRAYQVENQRNEVSCLLETFKDIRSNIYNKFETIKNIEATLEDRLKDVEVQMFLLNNYESEA